jgi:hypothetical protein
MDLPRGRADLMAMAIRYTLGSLSYVTPASLSGPTPCAAWDLATLLAHLSDSLAALQEAVVTGCVSLDLAAQGQAIPADGLAATLRVQARQLLAASSAGRADHPVAIAEADPGCPGHQHPGRCPAGGDRGNPWFPVR